MKKIHIYTSVLFIVSLLLNACNLETIVDLDIPQQPETLVVSSAFTHHGNSPMNNNDNWVVFVSHSTEGFNYSKSIDVSDAIVKVQDLDTDQSITFRNFSDGSYVSSTKPILNHSYAINVSSEKYGTVISSGKTLSETKIKEVKIVNVTETNDGLKRLNFQITFVDPIEPNQYRLRVLGTSSYQGSKNNSYPVIIYSLDPNIEFPTSNFGEGSKGGDLFLFRDLGYNGTTYTMDFYVEEYSYYNPDDSNNNSLSEISYTVLLSTLSEDLYQHEITKAIAISSGGGGLFSEPINIYSNIENGFGIFGGYSWDTLSVTNSQ